MSNRFARFVNIYRTADGTLEMGTATVHIAHMAAAAIEVDSEGNIVGFHVPRTVTRTEFVAAEFPA